MECIRCSNSKNLTMVKIHLAKLLELKDFGTSKHMKYSIQQTPTIYYVCDNCIDEYRRSTAKSGIIGSSICILLIILFIVFHHELDAETRNIVLIFIALAGVFVLFRIRYLWDVSNNIEIKESLSNEIVKDLWGANKIKQELGWNHYFTQKDYEKNTGDKNSV